METAIFLMSAGRILMGLIFLCSIFVDLKARTTLFNLMAEKRVKLPMFFYVGALTLKCVTSMAIILNFYSYYAALVLAIYIFIANLVFNNFWAVDAKRRDFVISLFLTNLSSCAGLLAIAGGIRKFG